MKKCFSVTTTCMKVLRTYPEAKLELSQTSVILQKYLTAETY